MNLFGIKQSELSRFVLHTTDCRCLPDFNQFIIYDNWMFIVHALSGIFKVIHTILVLRCTPCCSLC